MRFYIVFILSTCFYSNVNECCNCYEWLALLQIKIIVTYTNVQALITVHEFSAKKTMYFSNMHFFMIYKSIVIGPINK